MTIKAFFFFFIFHNYFQVLKINYFRKLTFQCKYRSYLGIGQLGNMEKTAGKLGTSFDFLIRLESLYCLKVNFLKDKSRIGNVLLLFYKINLKLVKNK